MSSTSNDSNSEPSEDALSSTWLDEQSVWSLLSELGIADDAERNLILDAWAVVGRSARAARASELRDSDLARIEFGRFSPAATSGIPPSISAADFAMVINDGTMITHARTWWASTLTDPAIEASQRFIDKLRAYLQQ